jgi:hypothetical protein
VTVRLSRHRDAGRRFQRLGSTRYCCSIYLSLTFEELAQLRHPLVHVWSRGATVLYVWSSGNGVERPLARGHEKLREFRADRPAGRCKWCQRLPGTDPVCQEQRRQDRSARLATLLGEALKLVEEKQR